MSCSCTSIGSSYTPRECSVHAGLNILSAVGKSVRREGGTFEGKQCVLQAERGAWPCWR